MIWIRQPPPGMRHNGSASRLAGRQAGRQAGSKGVPGKIVTQATIETVTKSVIFGVGVKTPDWRIEMFSFYSDPKNII